MAQARPVKHFIGVLITAFLISPVLILLFSGVTPAWSHEIAEVFAFTFLQALVSALLALLFGFAGAYGLEAASARFGRQNGKLLEALALLPNVAPVLLFLLAVMKFLPGVRGLSGIIFVHAMLNAGLVSATILRLFRSKVAGLADLAWVEGSSRTRFLFRVAFPILRQDLRVVFMFVFAICFSSLAVPLVIGGSQATTLEVLIWQTLRIDGDFARALGIALVQLASVLALTFLLRSKTDPSNAHARSASPLLSSLWGLPFAIVPALLLIVSMLDRPWVGASMFFQSEMGADVVRAFMGSLFVAIATGLLTATSLMLIAFIEPRGFWRKLLLGYVAPSSVVTGFALLVAWRALGFATYVKIIIALTLIGVPSFYRLYWDASLSALRAQRATALTLGASDALTFWRVVLPQLIRPASFIAGLASLWAWGDFALSRTIAERDMTLGLMIQSLMSTYRFEIATFLVWILLFGGAATFFIFEGAGRVFGQKSQS
jgi:thiamine transport system permease protein